VVRRAKGEGPQHVSIHGKEEVVIVAVDEFRRLQSAQTGEALIAALEACPHPEVDLEPSREPMPVRDVVL
jgi:hypothetical protein